MHRIRVGPLSVLLGLLAVAACAGRQGGREERVLPGITVLLRDSAHLIEGKRLGLLTNQTGVDEQGRSTIDLLVEAGARADSAKRPRLVALFAPEHGIRGTEDRQYIASSVDERTGLPIHSLYGRTTMAPPDSTLRDLDVLLIDLQDIGTRTWTYEGAMVYAMRAAKQNGVRVIVLDRPNPITGENPEGPVLDSAIAYAGTGEEGRPAKPFAIYPIPLRHGMTMGELALFYNSVLGLDTDLRVVPVANWRRSMWLDQTDLPWVRPSPNMPSLASALLYPGLVAFEGSNLSVGRGTERAFQQIGAPWLDPKRVIDLLTDRTLPGVELEAVTFTPEEPTDRKYAGQRIPGIRIRIADRNRVQSARLGAMLLWAVDSLHGDSLRVNERVFDDRWGDPALRRRLMAGEEPHTLMDREFPETMEFVRRARAYWLYR